MKTKRLMIILTAACSLLLIPLIAMQFTKEVDWDAFDFAVMGSLLLISGLMIELVLSTVTSLKGRVILCGLVLFVFLLIWAELAVGIFGSPFAGS